MKLVTNNHSKIQTVCHLQTELELNNYQLIIDLCYLPDKEIFSENNFGQWVKENAVKCDDLTAWLNHLTATFYDLVLPKYVLINLSDDESFNLSATSSQPDFKLPAELYPLIFD